jgi:hypothetical protein
MKFGIDIEVQRERNKEMDGTYERKFAWFPTELRNGQWIWLDYYYRNYVAGIEHYNLGKYDDLNPHKGFKERTK